MGNAVAREGHRERGRNRARLRRIADDFDGVGIGEVLLRGEAVGGGDHLDVRACEEGGGELVDEAGADERLVALHVDDVANAFEASGDLGDAVGAALVFGGGEGDLGAEGEGGLGDAHVIGGDDDLGEVAGAAAALPDVLDEGPAGDGMEGLAGETGGTPAGGEEGGDGGFGHQEGEFRVGGWWVSSAGDFLGREERDYEYD